MSLGSLVLKFRQKYEHGLHTAYYRDIVRYKILDSPPITNTLNYTCEIHVFTSANDWLNLIWALKSFYYFSKREYALCIHDDGTLTEENLNTLKYHFPNARIILRKEADAKVFALLEPYPRCLEFRRTNIYAPKLLDYRPYLQSDRMLMIDSDVLFFANPTELIQRIDNPQYCLNTVNGDIANAYTVDPAFVEAKYEFRMIEKFNSGLGLIHAQSLLLDWMEEFLGIPDFYARKPNLSRVLWPIEQTIYALCSSRFGVELLPPAYDVHLEGSINGSPCRHYVGKIRHLMYSEGIRHLVQNKFLKELQK
jgi:hypothetical protein